MVSMVRWRSSVFALVAIALRSLELLRRVDQ
jgi:hypothetical protein